MPKSSSKIANTTEGGETSSDVAYGSADRVELFRNWLHVEASLEGVFRALDKKSVHATDALGPIYEWIDFRLKKDPWIQRQLALVTDAEAERFTMLIYRAIHAYSEKYHASPGREAVPHVHRLHKERARKAIQKLVRALKELNFDPDIPSLLRQERHEWAKLLLRRETDATPREASLLAQMFQSQQIDQVAVEELRHLWHSRKQAPKVQDVLSSLDLEVSLLNAAPVTKFCARSMFLREIWSGLGGHTLEKKRRTFVAHVDDAVFPGHWTGEPEARLRELNRITSDLRKKELWFKKFFPELHSRLGS